MPPCKNTKNSSFPWSRRACGAGRYVEEESKKQSGWLLMCYFSWTPTALPFPPTDKGLKLWCCTPWTPASQLRFKKISCFRLFGIQNLSAFLFKVTREVWSGRCAEITCTSEVRQPWLQQEAQQPLYLSSKTHTEDMVPFQTIYLVAP